MNALQQSEVKEAQMFMNIEQIETNEPKERFKIENREQLHWAMRKLSALNAQQQEIDELAQKEIERIEQWHKAETKAIEDSRSYFEGLITEYLYQQREADPKFKSMKTPYGFVRFRKQQPQFHYNDEEVVSYLEQNGYTDLIRIKKEPNKADIKKLFEVHGNRLINTETGEPIPGIVVEHKEDEIEIVPK